MTNLTVTILATQDSATASHSIGHTNYEVIPVPLAVTDTFVVTDKTSSSFTLTTNNVDFGNDRIFTCLISEYGTPLTGENAYCNADDVKALCQIQYTQLEYDDDTAYQNALTTFYIPMAQKIVDNYVGHNFQNNTATLTLDGNGRRVLMVPPPYVPVSAAGTVLLGGVDITSNIAVYPTYLAYKGGVFTEDSSNRQNVAATLTYGYTAIPQDIRYATAQSSPTSSPT